MRTDDVIRHFGSKTNVARALGIGPAAVSKWKDRVPPLQAARLAQLTDNALEFDASSYAGWYVRNKKKAFAHA